MNEILSQSNQTFCATHKRAKICFANLSQNCQNPLMCSICLAQNQKNDPFISIDEVLFSDTSESISNWPPGIDSDSYQFLKRKSTSTLKECIQKEIFSFYDKLRSEINQILNEKQKQMLMKLDNISIGSDEVIDLYNKLFKRQELVYIFANGQIFDKNKYLNLLKLISETQDKDKKELSENIKAKKMNERTFRQFQQHNIDDCLDEIIQRINENIKIFQHQKKEGEEINDLQFETSSFGSYFTFTENLECQRLSNEKIMSLQLQINTCLNMSTLLFEESKQFEVKYETNNITKIMNSSKNEGILQSYFLEQLTDHNFFTFKFTNLTSLKQFKFGILPNVEGEGENILKSIAKLYEDFDLCLINQTNPPLEYSIDINSKYVKLSYPLLKNQKYDVEHQSKEKFEYFVSFAIQSHCDCIEFSC